MGEHEIEAVALVFLGHRPLDKSVSLSVPQFPYL